MIAECPSCNHRARLYIKGTSKPATEIPPGVTITCAKCKGRFVVNQGTLKPESTGQNAQGTQNITGATILSPHQVPRFRMNGHGSGSERK